MRKGSDGLLQGVEKWMSWRFWSIRYTDHHHLVTMFESCADVCLGLFRSYRQTLAGVTLNYGVTVAQIRKCNKMWASDSIHLRNVLYIPLYAADTSKILVPGVSTSGSERSVPRELVRTR